MCLLNFDFKQLKPSSNKSWSFDNRGCAGGRQNVIMKNQSLIRTKNIFVLIISSFKKILNENTYNYLENAVQ